MTHLIDDETVAKMGHPNLDVGHPANASGTVEAIASSALEVTCEVTEQVQVTELSEVLSSKWR